MMAKLTELFQHEERWLTQEEYNKLWYETKENDVFALLKEALAYYEKNRNTQAPDEKWCASGMLMHLAKHLVDANRHLLEFAKKEEEDTAESEGKDE